MARKSKAQELVDQVAGADGAEPGPLPDGFTRRHYGPALAREGDVLVGKYLGEGTPRKFKRGKKTRMVPTYKIERDGGGVVEIFGAFQIEQFLAECKKGQRVYIKRLGQVDTSGGQRVNQYDVAAED